jgi:DNA-binding transcriptional LysR family regulator
MALVASPGYLDRHGTPADLADLAHHNLIGFNFARTVDGWPFLDGDRIVTVPALGNAQVGDGETARQLVLGGVGIARLALFHIGPDIAVGRLRPVLETVNPGETEAVHAVYLGQGGHLPARVRAVLDFLIARIASRSLV